MSMENAHRLPLRYRLAWSALWLMLLGALLVFAPAARAADGGRMLDDLSHPDVWMAKATDDITVQRRPIAGKDGAALCLDFDFHGVSGGATLRRALPIDWPGNYMLRFDVRGAMPPNDLQVKLIDASGDNVWWYRREAFQPAAQWQTISVGKREIISAWGPAPDRTLRHSAALEFTVYAGHGGQGELCLDNLRLVPLRGEAAREPMKRTSVSSAPNAFFQQLAKRATRGLYPRGFSGEQSYWTLVGVDGGAAHSALFSEDGAVELRKGGWSIEPMLFEGRQVVDWARVKTAQTLLDGYLPLPAVHWQEGDLRLDTRVAAQGTPAHSRLLLDYTLHNDAPTTRTLTLGLLARPFQVNPPTQFLNTPGGASPIHDLAWNGRVLQVNHDLRVIPLQPPTAFVASSYDAGALPERLARGERPQVSALHDDAGFAQGALLYQVTLPAHASARFALVVPGDNQPFIAPADGARWIDQQRAQVAAVWRESLNRVRIALPPAQQAISDTARSAQAQMLMSHDGPKLQPGTRSYARSWIRDGAMMSEALLRSGHADVVGAFVRWYAPQQFHTGKVPCCVDARGADPVPENDSQGELLFAIAQWWRYSHDRAGLQQLWPHVERTVAYMDRLRASERTPANQAPARRALVGLMPASISHEGYSAKPMHSYWDDFWSLIGYDDAVQLAHTLGHDEQAMRFAVSRDQFRTDLQHSITAAVQEHGIDFLPGAAELGDFDPTSSTIALSPGSAQTWLPPALLRQTFERYWQQFLARRDGRTSWDDYTPYEWRNVAAFVRLGWRDRVAPLFEFFMAARRPTAWNQWAEVVGRDPRQPRFVGDMPHAWIASDYLRSVYDLFAFERAGDHSLVLGAGIPTSWLHGHGVSIAQLRTPYGSLSYTLHEQHDTLALHIAAGLTVPAGGLVLPWPYPKHTPGRATLDGRAVAPRTNALGQSEWVIRQLPATLTIALPAPVTGR